MQFRLFDELYKLVAVHAEFAKARWRVHPEHSAGPAVAQMVIELGAEVRVSQTVAVGDSIVLGPAEIARRGPRNPPAGHRQLAGIGEGDLPVAGVIDAVHLDGVGLELDRHVAVHLIEIQKVVANDLALVAHAQHEPAKAEARIMFHDVEKDRVRADRHHRLRAKVGHFFAPRAEPAAKNKDGYFRNIQCRPPPHRPAPPPPSAAGFVTKPPTSQGWRPTVSVVINRDQTDAEHPWAATDPLRRSARYAPRAGIGKVPTVAEREASPCAKPG